MNIALPPSFRLRIHLFLASGCTRNTCIARIGPQSRQFRLVGNFVHGVPGTDGASQRGERLIPIMGQLIHQCGFEQGTFVTSAGPVRVGRAPPVLRPYHLLSQDTQPGYCGVCRRGSRQAAPGPERWPSDRLRRPCSAVLPPGDRCRPGCPNTCTGREQDPTAFSVARTASG